LDRIGENYAVSARRGISTTFPLSRASSSSTDTCCRAAIAFWQTRIVKASLSCVAHAFENGQKKAAVRTASRTASVDGESGAIERMKALRAAGIGFDRIATQLNAEGVKTRTGARWHGLVVNRILAGKGRKAA
jgi:hypothetical protein